MIKLLPPKSYGTIKPLANSQGQPIRCTPPATLKKRRRPRPSANPIYRLNRARKEHSQ